MNIKTLTFSKVKIKACKQHWMLWMEVFKYRNITVNGGNFNLRIILSLTRMKQLKILSQLTILNVLEKSPAKRNVSVSEHKMSQLMRLWYASHRWPVKVQASLRIHAVSPEPSLFAHMKYGHRRRVRPKIRHLAPLDGCACAFERVYGGRKVP